MAKGGNSLSSKRSRNAKPYDANNSFVKKVATKVTDLIPQRSWISKWFNSSQDNGEMVHDVDNPEESDNEEEPAQPPPTKRPRIRMDVTHPPGTFKIQPRSRTLVDEADPHRVHNETTADFLEPPVAGTSGIRRLVASTPAIQSEVKTTTNQRSRAKFTPLNSVQNNGAANGTDDNSESSESTSVCSSFIPQVNRQEASSLGYNRPFTNRKRYGDEKLNFTNHLQSPRSLFLDSNQRDSLSSRRPSFNASLMNNSVERGPSYSSPFYNGNTTFGGANTAGFQRRGRTLFNSTNEIQLKVPNRTNIQVKSPSAAGTDSSGMSQTAKRILEALEHFSSPILDAKKIPMNANNTNSSPIGGKKRQRDETGSPLARVGLRHLTRELTVPTVPDLLKLRRRQRLQDTTVAARKIVSAHNAPAEYRLRPPDDEKPTKYSGKVKAKDKTDFEEDLTGETVNLPSISLPISTLPTFDIMLPAKKSNVARGGNAKEELFKFASPIKVTDTSRNLKSINNFTFSKPLNANDRDSINDDSYTLSKTLTVESDASTFSSTSSTSATASNFIWSNTSTAPKLKEKFKEKDNNVEGFKAATSLKSGSVMDILGKKSDPLMDAWKPAVGMWECSQCLIRNAKDETQCVACKASKSLPKVEKKSSESSIAPITQSKPVIADCFGSQFKMSSNQWECDACMVRNKQTDIKCVSCTTPRPGSVKTPSFGSTSDSLNSGKSDLMEKFKPAEGSWECPGCLLRNPGTVETCPCCNDSKPGSLKISPKKVPANLANTEKSKTAETVDSSSSTLTKTDSSGFGDKFKKPEGAWTCDDCMLQNKGDAIECIACCAPKPGAKKVAKPAAQTSSGSTIQFNFGMPKDAGSFKFGIDKSEEKVPEATGKTATQATGFSFGSKTEAPKTGGFTFGVPQNSTGFTFGVNPDPEKSKTETTKDTTKENVEPVSKKRSLNAEEEPKNPPTFSFGVPKTDETKPAEGKQFQPSFSFGSIKTGSVTQEKTNELPKISFGIPVSSTEAPKLNFSSAPAEKPAPTLSNNFPNLQTTNTTESKPAAQLPGYGTTQASTTIGASMITKTTSSAPPTVYSTFGTATTIPSQSSTLPTQSFGQNQQACPPVVPGSGLFLFGSNKPANTTTATPPPEKSSTLSFGGSNTTTNFSGTNSTPLFTAEGSEKKTVVPAFGVPESKAPAPFGTTENKTTPLFGAQDNKIMFENPAKKPAPTFNSTTPSFGVSSSSALPAFGSGFGNAGTSNPFEANSTTNMFAAPKPASKPVAPALFTFSGGNPRPAEPSSGFNFLSNNSAPSTTQPPAQEKLFTFGNTQGNQQTGAGFGAPNNFSASAAPESTPASFTFNAPPKSDPPAFGQTAPIATPMFGAPQSTPTFGQTQPTTAFGSAAPAPNPGGFNFGGSAPAAQSGFNFGGQAPAAAPTGGFAPNPNPSIAFDPNTPPTFNFTGGSTLSGFNATPQAAHSRKFKKAVRRTQPR